MISILLNIYVTLAITQYLFSNDDIVIITQYDMFIPFELVKSITVEFQELDDDWARKGGLTSHVAMIR